MRIIHGAGYTDKDRAEFRQLIFQNVLKAVQILTEAMEALKINYSDVSNRVSIVFGLCLSVCVGYKECVAVFLFLHAVFCVFLFIS